jgi:pyruvate ferredoxin oxidoreductase delta subunit
MIKYEVPRLDRPWREVNPGGVVLEPGNAITYVTGTWRSMRPARDLEQCTQCLICWVVCPDASVTVENGKVTGFDYAHCKGCGICSEQCPVTIKKPHAQTGKIGKVIQMVPETDSDR